MGKPQVNASAMDEWRGILARTGLIGDVTARGDGTAADSAPTLSPVTGANQLSRQKPAPATTREKADGVYESAGLDDFVRLLERARTFSRDQQLAWRVGSHADYATRGAIGRAVTGAATLGEGLRRLVTYYPLVQDATLLSLTVDGDQATLSYRILDPEIWPRHEDALYSLGLYSGLVKIAAPDVWPDVEILIEAEKDWVRADLSGIVKAPVSYGETANALRFPATALSARLAEQTVPDAGLLKTLSRDLVDARRRKPVSDRLRDVMLRAIHEGAVAQETVARELGLSSRTLRRKLAAEGLSFQGLLDECRMQVAALEFRARPALSLSELALKLGYSEHSTFSRAFARWAGMAPQDYRRSVAVH